MTRRTYYAPTTTEDEPVEATDAVAPMWGYTLDDINRLARMSMSRQIGWSTHDKVDRYETAWDAIAYAIVSADAAPTVPDLVYAGWSAIVRDSESRKQSAGRDANGNVRPSCVAYWKTANRAMTPMEDKIVDRIAVGQILAALTDLDRNALIALAATGNKSDTAIVLGLKSDARYRIRKARRIATKLWHEGETPPPLKMDKHYHKELKTHCIHGHEWIPENIAQRWSTRHRRYERCCRLCRQGRNDARRRQETA